MKLSPRCDCRRFVASLLVIGMAVMPGAVLAAPPAQRIVSLAPHLTELVYAAGAGDKLIGVSSYSDYPAEAARVPVVGSYGKVNIEALLKLQPDLILAWRSGNPAGDLAELQRRGFNVQITEAATLTDVAQLLRLVGTLAGTSEIAEPRAAAFERQIDALRQRYERVPTVKVFVEITHEPLMTVNRDHIIDEVLRLCGAANIFANAAPLTPVVSREQLYVRRPDMILSTTFPDAAAALKAWRQLAAIPSVIRGSVYVVHPDLLTRMGPRLAEGAAAVCEAIEEARQADR